MLAHKSLAELLATARKHLTHPPVFGGPLGPSSDRRGRRDRRGQRDETDEHEADETDEADSRPTSSRVDMRYERYAIGADIAAGGRAFMRSEPVAAVPLPAPSEWDADATTVATVCVAIRMRWRSCILWGVQELGGACALPVV